MYCFTKKCSNNGIASDPSEVRSSQDFTDYLSIFNFADYIYQDKQKEFSKISRDNPTVIPDIAASVLRGLAKGNYLSDYLYQKGLNCCRDILSDMCYKETHIDTIRADIAQDQDRIIFIPGCQTEDILTSRAECAAKVFKGLHTSARFVPAGKNHGRDKVKIYNEAARIKTILERRLGSDIEIIPLEIEQESLRTQENIQQLFMGNYIDTTRITSVLIVSSTFHLIRLSIAIDSYILNSNNKFPKLNRIVLVGAEDKVSSVVKNDVYARNLFFDIYYYLFTNVIMKTMPNNEDEK